MMMKMKEKERVRRMLKMVSVIRFLTSYGIVSNASIMHTGRIRKKKKKKNIAQKQALGAPDCEKTPHPVKFHSVYIVYTIELVDKIAVFTSIPLIFCCDHALSIESICKKFVQIVNEIVVIRFVGIVI